MVTYKILLKPLMPYFFGGEHTFSMIPSNERSPYFIVSEPMPPQTTLFGMLRYEVLKHSKALSGKHNDPNEEKEIREKQIDLIGEKSFSFRTEDQAQTFGKINRISPVFIESEGTAFFPTPFAFVVKDRKRVQLYLENADDPVTLSGNVCHVPYADGEVLNDKCYPVGGFVAENGKDDTPLFKAFEDFITHEIRVGIDARRTTPDRSDENCFFKKSFCKLNNNSSFCFYAYLEEDLLPQKDMVYMGQGKSAFAFEAIKVDDDGADPFADEMNKLAHLIDVPDNSYKVYYAVSDCYFVNGLPDTLWRMIATRPSHHLETNYHGLSEGNYKASLSKYKEQQIFIQKGSVFFVNGEIPKDESAVYKIGMNHLIKIGG